MYAGNARTFVFSSSSINPPSCTMMAADKHWLDSIKNLRSPHNYESFSHMYEGDPIKRLSFPPLPHPTLI